MVGQLRPWLRSRSQQQPQVSREGRRIRRSAHDGTTGAPTLLMSCMARGRRSVKRTCHEGRYLVLGRDDGPLDPVGSAGPCGVGETPVASSRKGGGHTLRLQRHGGLIPSTCPEPDALAASSLEDTTLALPYHSPRRGLEHPTAREEFRAIECGQQQAPRRGLPDCTRDQRMRSQRYCKMPIVSANPAWTPHRPRVAGASPLVGAASSFPRIPQQLITVAASLSPPPHSVISVAAPCNHTPLPRSSTLACYFGPRYTSCCCCGPNYTLYTFVSSHPPPSQLPLDLLHVPALSEAPRSLPTQPV